MKTKRQTATHRCDRCSAQASVTPTEAPHEFDWSCSCGKCGLISWDNAAPAPEFVPLHGTVETTAEGAEPRAKQVKGKAAMKKSREELLENAVPMAELVDRILVCELSNDEQRERGEALANAQAEQGQLLEEKKEVVNGFKTKEQQVVMRIGELQRVVRERREYRDVDCVEWHDYKAGKVYVVRHDLGTCVETRNMTHTERQQQLPNAIAEKAMDHTAEQLGLEKVSGENKTDATTSTKKKSRQAASASA